MDAALPEPRRFDPDAVPRLRWGAVGTGWVARAFVGAVHAHSRQHVVAVTARDAARTAAFAAEFGVDRVSPNVAALVTDPEVDVVYVATPHTSHREVALAAIAAGKHVLVEKPFAISAAEGAEIAAAAQAAGVLAMEAMWTRYLPQSDLIRRVVADGVIGDLHLVTADFGFPVPFDPAHRLWDPALGGGALLDMGVYPLAFASSLIGAPAHVVAAGELTGDGVDTRVALQLTSGSGVIAQLGTSIVSALPVRASVAGSLGRIEIAAPFFCPSTVTVSTGTFEAPQQRTWTDTTFATTHEGLCHQATALAGYVGEGRTESPLHPLDETVAVLATIDEARRQLGVGHGAGTAPPSGQ